MADHPDRQRVLKLVDEFFEQLAEVEAEYSVSIALDDAAIVALPVVREPDDTVPSESIFTVYTTTRGHAQVGLLRLAALRAERDFIRALDNGEE